MNITPEDRKELILRIRRETGANMAELSRVFEMSREHMRRLVGNEPEFQETPARRTPASETLLQFGKPPRNLGAYMYRFRRKHGLTQQDAATLCATHFARWSKWERGVEIASPGMIYRYVMMLDRVLTEAKQEIEHEPIA